MNYEPSTLNGINHQDICIFMVFPMSPMYRNLCAFVCKRSAKFLALIACILLVSLSAHAQHRTDQGLTYGGGSGGDNPGDGFGIAINGGYDIPTGDLGKTFKAAPAFGFGLIDNFNGFSFSANFGLVTYKPKIDTIYYYAPKQTIGSLAWNDDKIMEYYLGAAYNIQVDDGVKFFLGLNAGIYSDKISYHTVDIYENTIFNKTEQELYFAPKVGFSFDVSDNFSINPGIKYNYFKPLGGTDNNPYIYTSNSAFSLNMSLVYVF